MINTNSLPEYVRENLQRSIADAEQIISAAPIDARRAVASRSGQRIIDILRQYNKKGSIVEMYGLITDFFYALCDDRAEEIQKTRNALAELQLVPKQSSVPKKSDAQSTEMNTGAKSAVVRQVPALSPTGLPSPYDRIEKGLLEMARQNPDDAGPPLVLADWKEDEGVTDEAELLRLAPAEDQLWRENNDETRAARTRLYQLRDQEIAAWNKRLQKEGIPVRQIWLKNGLFSGAFMTVDDFLTHAPKIFTLAPQFHDLAIAHPTAGTLGQLAEIIDDPLNHTALLDALRRCAASPYAAQLDCLRLELRNCADEGTEIIARGFPNLEKLILRGNHISDTGARSVAGLLPHMKYLNLNANDLTEEGFSHLAQLPALEHLELANNAIGDSMEVSSPAPIRYLLLDRNPIGNAGAIAIARNFTHLQNLNLEGTGVTAEGQEEIINIFRARGTPFTLHFTGRTVTESSDRIR